MKISENNPRHLFQRLLRARAHLEPVQPRYCIVWEQPGADGAVAVTVPDPNWLAMALAGGYLPPVDVYHQLRCRWRNEVGDEVFTLVNERPPGPGEWEGGTVVNGHLLHQVRPIGPMTEEEAMHYLLEKDVPRQVWHDHDRVNRPRFAICRREQLPADRRFRESWRLSTFVNDMGVMQA